jgi:hypothetical protein
MRGTACTTPQYSVGNDTRNLEETEALELRKRTAWGRFRSLAPLKGFVAQPRWMQHRKGVTQETAMVTFLTATL